ncbi:hypothetical protein PILCRDRAFT_688558 [Piloderma croceum F 1598]|uniref:Sister chromatid cohesion protein DCC1 n=1 Tax=Piloderma croceum (strain F 1598) TaxID=765440 RepID=A0A0C3AMK9_PILCF|nr:hypothetical protein PILCRDRAFT_688558 [Piloderma croceum F 1598]
MAEHTLRFSPTSSKDVASFKLLELPPDLCALIESAVPPTLTIKGHPSEEAVLCTSNKTYAIRSVVLSNTVLVVTRSPGGNEEDTDTIVIRDQVKEVLELVPSVPRLHKLGVLLRGMGYDEGQDEEGMDVDDDILDGDDDRPPKRRKLTYPDAQREIQASEAELSTALKSQHILILNGALRPITPSYLTTVLELVLTTLISHGLPHTSAVPVKDVVDALAEEYEVKKEVGRQVLEWFGEIVGGVGDREKERWEMDVEGVVREVGLGILRNHKDDPIAEDEFLTQWKKAVGDTFESAVSLPLLSGNYLSTSFPDTHPKTLTYFPSSSLPLDPPSRFSDLFLTRPKWLAADIAPFLADCAVDKKERDKLLLKYARATTEGTGKEVYYTARGKM